METKLIDLIRAVRLDEARRSNGDDSEEIADLERIMLVIIDGFGLSEDAAERLIEQSFI